jgi:hypothetical protein
VGGCPPTLGVMKSRDEHFALSLLQNVMEDCSHHISARSLSRDFDYVKRRFSSEGLSFLTKTLPRFFKAVLCGVETGVYTPPLGFKTLSGGLLPTFLSGWTKRIFTDSGVLLPDADPYSFQELYQICALCYKLDIPYSKEQEATVVSRFIQNEHEVKGHVLPDDGPHSSVRTLARRLVNRVLGSLDPRNIRPKHGPGAVASGERGNSKYEWSRKYQRLHNKYPYYEYFSPSLTRLSHESNWYRLLKPELNPIAKVVLVPKDSRGPRLISMEPLEIQWIQQGLHRLIVDRVESHPLTREEVRFTDQAPNGQEALKSSLSGDFATIDLKDASDRISLSLAREIFPKDLFEHMESCRSVATELPDGTLQSLSKFAPMGSALCFPVLALVVWSLTSATLRLKHRSRRRVLVYGDDLIVPSEDYDDVVEVLRSHGLEVNLDKSFRHGPFRESCGVDAFKGVNVTPVRWRRSFDSSLPSSSVYCHLIDMSEHLFNRGFWKSCRFVRQFVSKVFGKVPWTHDSSFPGFLCPDISVCNQRNSWLRWRFNAPLQRHEALVLRPVASKTDSPFSSYSQRMLKGLTGLYAFSPEDEKVTLRNRCSLHRRWTSM